VKLLIKSDRSATTIPREVPAVRPAELQVEERRDVVYRSEVDRLVDVVVRGLDAGGGARVLLVGPPGCGKSTLVEQALRTEGLRAAAERRGLRYMGVKAEYDLGSLNVTLVDHTGRAERLSGAVWADLYSRLKETCAKQPFLVAALDGVDRLRPEAVPLALDWFGEWVGRVAFACKAQAAAVAAVGSKTLEAVAYDRQSTWLTNYAVYYVLGLSYGDFSALFKARVKDAAAWKRRGGPGDYDAWRLTGGLPRYFDMLIEDVASGGEFDKWAFLLHLAEDFGIPEAVRRLGSADALRKALKSPDLLDKPDYADLRRLLLESGVVVRFESPDRLLTEVDGKYAGGRYALAVPALAEYVAEASEKELMGDE